MEPDKYQQAWQTHSAQTRVTIDADSLLNVVRRSQRDFRATIFWRDFREVGVSILLIPLWLFLGIIFSLPWTWYLEVPALIGVAAFFLVDRMRHPQKPSEPGEPLQECIQNSLAQVEHQIWLLRNVLWWYILPFAIPMLVFFAHVVWQMAVETNGWLAALAFGSFLFVFVFAIDSFIYYINQLAVRRELEPQRQELRALLASLNNDTAIQASGEYPILIRTKRVECSPRRMFVAGLCFFAILLVGVPVTVFLGYKIDQYLNQESQEYPKKSPFAAVRWQDSQPEVKVGDDWFKLISLDGIPASKIVDFSRRTYDDLWQKRFEEDLVELLTRMGHPPQHTVTLVVQSLTSSQTRTLEDVPMTEANRRAIRAAAQARANPNP